MSRVGVNNSSCAARNFIKIGRVVSDPSLVVQVPMHLYRYKCIGKIVP